VRQPYDLERFLEAQEDAFAGALEELRRGRKTGHWMWFVFPQLAGLGRSPTAHYFGIHSADEAQAYLAHPLLGPRFRTSVEALLAWADRRSAEQILGSVDALKLRSSLTLFDQLEFDTIFSAALKAFFGGDPDPRTLALLNGHA
jgi:uncharacterized protein (DUF1810 family)